MSWLASLFGTRDDDDEPLDPVVCVNLILRKAVEERAERVEIDLYEHELAVEFANSGLTRWPTGPRRKFAMAMLDRVLSMAEWHSRTEGAFKVRLMSDHRPSGLEASIRVKRRGPVGLTLFVEPS